MSEDEKKAIDILKDFTENEDTKYCYDWQGFDHETILNAIRLTLKLLEDKTKGLKSVESIITDQDRTITEKNNKIFKLECSVEEQQKEIEELKEKNQNQLEEKQSTEIKDLENQLERSNYYIDFYQDLCDKQNTLLKNVCAPYGLDKVHYVFMSYTDSNGEDRRLEIHNENISDKCYDNINKEGDNNE